MEPRGSRRYDNQDILDLRLEKVFKIGSASDKIAVYADIANVFNSGTTNSRLRRSPGGRGSKAAAAAANRHTQAATPWTSRPWRGRGCMAPAPALVAAGLGREAQGPRRRGG